MGVDARLAFGEGSAREGEVAGPVELPGLRLRLRDDCDDRLPGYKLNMGFVKEARILDTQVVNFFGVEDDPSRLRECLGLNLARDALGFGPRCTFAELWIDDDFLGVFPVGEEADDAEFLRHAFCEPDADDGALFKCSGACGPCDFVAGCPNGDPGADGCDDLYEPRAGTTSDDVDEQVGPLLGCVGGPDFAACFAELADLDAWITATAFDLILPDTAGMAVEGENFLLYRHPARGFLPYGWDRDDAFVPLNTRDHCCYLGSSGPLACDNRDAPLVVERLREAFGAELEARVDELTAPDGPLALDRVLARIDAYAALLAPYREGDLVDRALDADWEAQVDILRRHVTARWADVASRTCAE
jgi:hypothetical protein